MKFFKRRKGAEDVVVPKAQEQQVPATEEAESRGSSARSGRKRFFLLLMALLAVVLGGAAYFLPGIGFMGGGKPDPANFQIKRNSGPNPFLMPPPENKAPDVSASDGAQNQPPEGPSLPSSMVVNRAPAVPQGTPMGEADLPAMQSREEKPTSDEPAGQSAEEAKTVSHDVPPPTMVPSDLSADPFPWQGDESKAVETYKALLLKEIGREMLALSRAGVDPRQAGKMTSFSDFQEFKRYAEAMKLVSSARDHEVKVRTQIISSLLDAYKSINETFRSQDGIGELAAIMNRMDDGMPKTGAVLPPPPPAMTAGQEEAGGNASLVPEKRLEQQPQLMGKIAFLEKKQVWLRDGRVLRIGDDWGDGYKVTSIDLERNVVILQKGKKRKELGA